MKLVLPSWIGWSLVDILNRVGASTLPSVRPFFFFLHLLHSVFSSTYNLLLDRKFAVLCNVVEFRYQKSMVHCVVRCRHVDKAVPIIFPFW